jgi:hypothetical protein
MTTRLATADPDRTRLRRPTNGRTCFSRYFVYIAWLVRPTSSSTNYRVSLSKPA